MIESSFAKLRLYKIPEFTVASFMLAVLAVVIFLFEPSFGDVQLSVFGAAATIAAVVVLLLEFGMLRSQDVWEQLRLYALGSAVVAALAIATAATGRGGSALYVLGAVTIALKALLFPIGIRFVLRRLEAEPRVPSVIGVAERDPDRDRAVRAVRSSCCARSTSAPRRRCRCRRCRSRSAACWSRSC